MSGSHGGSSHARKSDRNQDHETSHRFLGSGLSPAVLPLPISSIAVLGPDRFARFSRLQNFVACLLQRFGRKVRAPVFVTSIFPQCAHFWQSPVPGETMPHYLRYEPVEAFPSWMARDLAGVAP
jgi:hypothetical protein